MHYKSLFLLLTLTAFYSLQGQELKVMTYNIKYDNVNDTINNWNDRKEKLVELIEHYGPSFIGTQEALHRQVAYIDSSLTDFSYIGVGREDGKQKGEYSAIHYDSTLYKVLKARYLLALRDTRKTFRRVGCRLGTYLYLWTL